MVNVSGAESLVELDNPTLTVSACVKLAFRRVTVRDAAFVPAPSETETLERLRENVGAASSSMTVTVAVPEVSPVAAAVTITSALPINVVSLTTDPVNVADVCPARIVTVGGTVNRAVVADVRLTVKACVVTAPLRVTVNVSAPAVAFSLTEASVDVKVSDAVSSSTTVTVRCPLTNTGLVEDAVMITGTLPSVSVLGTGVPEKVVDEEFAGMVTVAGTVSRPGVFDDSVTMTS
jgi:hypothetical protein